MTFTKAVTNMHSFHSLGLISSNLGRQAGTELHIAHQSHDLFTCLYIYIYIGLVPIKIKLNPYSYFNSEMKNLGKMM